MINKEKQRFQDTILRIFKYITFLNKEILNEISISFEKIDCFNKIYDDYVSLCHEVGNNMNIYLNDKKVSESDNIKRLKFEVAKLPLYINYQTLVYDSKKLDKEKLSLYLLNNKLNFMVNTLINLFSTSSDLLGDDKEASLDIYKLFLEVIYNSKRISIICNQHIDLINDSKEIYEFSSLYYMHPEELIVKNNDKTGKTL